MREITERDFLGNPMRFINLAAYEDEFTSVNVGKGRSAVIISDTEWQMLLQALKICTEHPEWTTSS